MWIDELRDLGRYSHEPSEGGVVAWVEHSEPGTGGMMEFTITAQTLTVEKEL